MHTLQDIKGTLTKHKPRLFREYPIRSLAIFGSYSRLEQHEQSDLDLIVDFSDKIGIRFIDLAEELESILGMKVDLVSKNGIQPKYLESIDQDLVYV
jgi:predicted nucleotidyltransferase